MKDDIFKIYIDLFLEELNKFEENLKSLYPQKEKEIREILNEMKNIILNEEIKNIDSLFLILKKFNSLYDNFLQTIPDFAQHFNKFLENFFKRFLKQIK